MTHTDVAPLVAPEYSEAAFCAHCGLEVQAPQTQPWGQPQFCCSGCSTAFALLHDKRLEAYYSLGERRQQAVVASGRSFDEFDHPAFRELYVKEEGSTDRVDLVLEGIHCASCVWLVERAPLFIPGVVRAELNMGRAMVTLEWDRRILALSSIARTFDSLGYTPHAYRAGAREEVARKNERSALVRLGVSGAIAANVMLAALAMYSGALGPGLEEEYERFFRWISLVLVVPALVWPGSVFFKGAIAAVRTRSLHLDLPIAIALAAGFARGAVNTITGEGPVYLDGIAVLVFLLLVGRYLQQRWQRAATDASELLSALTPKSARIIDEHGEVRDLPVAGLLPGMLIHVRAGDTFAADGVVESGLSAVNRSWLTGESNHISIGPGDFVHAGTINLGAPVRVRVSRSGEETRVAQLMQQVQETSERRAPVVLLANRMAGIFVGVTLALAVLTWLVGRLVDPDAAFDNAIALLIVTCPCALAMATPLSVTVALGRAARRGIFVRGGDVLQSLSTPGRIFLDKTGTITHGQGELMSWQGPDWVRPLILAAEAGSVHPVAEALRRAWPDVRVPVASSTLHRHGAGVVAIVEDACVVVGAPSFVAAYVGELQSAESFNDALTPVHVAVDGVLTAIAGVGDRVRNEARGAIEQLVQRGWQPAILSGDTLTVALGTASLVGIDASNVFAEASPEAKLEIVRAESTRSMVVMAGDGVNDAAAMAAASVGIAVHGGAEAALTTADVFFTREGLEPLVELADGARRTMRVIRRNIVVSLAYNVVGIGLAMTGVLSPVVAAVMMPASSLTVIAGAWLGRTFPDPQ